MKREFIPLGAAVILLSASLWLKQHGSESGAPTNLPKTSAELRAAAPSTLAFSDETRSRLAEAAPQVQAATVPRPAVPETNAGAGDSVAKLGRSSPQHRAASLTLDELRRRKSQPGSEQSADWIQQLAHLSRYEVEVVREETDGVITYEATADYDSLATAQEKAEFLRDLAATGGERATTGLLYAFLAEPDIKVKAEILSAASLLINDENIRRLLQTALSSTQPLEVRLHAIYHAAETAPDLLAAYRSDPDPAIRTEVASAFDQVSDEEEPGDPE